MHIRWKLRQALRVLLACTLLGASAGVSAARPAAPIVMVAPVTARAGSARGPADVQVAQRAWRQVPVAAAPAFKGLWTLAPAAAAHWAVALAPRAATRPLYILRQALLR